MNLLRFFRKEKTVELVGNNPVVTRPALEKPASERFGKTVMPNAARVMEPDGAVHGFSEPATGKGMSLGGTGASPRSLSAPATLAPVGERTVALQLAELIPQIPTELLGDSAVDSSRSLVFNAAELERGMANGRPSVSLRSIYQQAPTIFTSEVGAEDKREVPLPFHRVLERFASLQVRDDQELDAAVPQVETPFLQVTLEDKEKFGMPIAEPRVAAASKPIVPSVASARGATPLSDKVVPQGGAASGAAKSEPATAPVAPPKPIPAPALAPRAPVRMSLPNDNPTTPAPAALAPNEAGKAKPTPPFAFSPAEPAKGKPALPAIHPPNEPEQPEPALPVARKLFPNGAGAPISERVPASIGSSAPTPLPSPLAPARPATRIPFKMPPVDPSPPVPLKLNAEVPPVTIDSSEGPRIRLSLRNVLRGIPPFQIEGSIETVPEKAQIELPFALVQPQLSLGRVAISPTQFQAAMPEEFRPLYRLDEGGMPVSLPLPEILQNLPDESLQIRDDQVEVQTPQLFETPFSQKAAEDAARLNAPAGPIAKSLALARESDPLVAPKAEAPAVSLPTLGLSQPPPPMQSQLPPEAGTNVTADAKSTVSQLSKLAGIKACAVVFSDGLSLAGNLPAEYEADALCAMAPEIMKRLDQQMAGANLGDLQSLTVFCAKAPVSFFSAGDICLAALHSTASLPEETRGQLGRATQELARTYARPALP
jgi:predicted regulator of Ras-like GTPase activity (Roadblock/LC7/MglB family)